MRDRKETGKPANDRTASAEQSLSPGKSTLTSRLTGPEIDRPAPQNERSVPAGGHPVADPAHGTPPTEETVFPYDSALKSTPGEQIIFGANYKHDRPSLFKLVYTSTGGHFGTQGSGVRTRTIPGLEATNVDWFIDARWNGTTAVTMKLEVQRSDGSVVATKDWTFGKKTLHPTTISQHEGEEERDIPARYLYKLGPSSSPGQDAYVGFTILELFGPNRSNLKVADIKPEYATTHGLDSDDKVTSHFFPVPSGHGTFTVSPGDLMADEHRGLQGALEAKAQLRTPKQIEKSVDQTYESNPGTALGRYRITRILKPDGAAKLTKKKL